MKKELAKHHASWLSAHPERSEDWLREKLKEGFDVHHIDGCHSNNDPSNLILIDHVDHMRIHDMPSSNRLRKIRMATLGGNAKKAKAGTAQGTPEYRKLCYDKAVMSVMTWKQVAHSLGLPSARIALSWAKRHAQEAGRQWPIGRTLE